MMDASAKVRNYLESKPRLLTSFNDFQAQIGCQKSLATLRAKTKNALEAVEKTARVEEYGLQAFSYHI
jgi:hypothetical protein